MVVGIRSMMAVSTTPHGLKGHRLDELPPFPAIATKMLKLLSNDDARIDEIVGLIRADPSLASALLRVVNSAAYGVPSRIDNIQKAVTFIGFDKVRNFAITVSMKGFLHTALRLDLVRLVWRHSLACGIICESLATACSSCRPNDDSAYTGRSSFTT